MQTTPNVPARRPIESAFAVAALRAASTKEADPELANPDHFAWNYVPLGRRLLLSLPAFVTRRWVERISPGSYAYFLARTKFVDRSLELALGRGARQVVVLGAGFDSRAHRFADALAGVAVFEVDLPATQMAKLERLRQLSIASPGNVRYVPLDLGRTSLPAALEAASFDPKLKTFFIWEGVSYYLEESTVDDVLEFVGRGCRSGSSIVFDYALKSFVDGDDSTYGGREIRRWLEENDEPFLFGLEPGALPSFLERRGLSPIRDLGPEEIASLFLTRTSGEVVGRPLGHLRLAYAQSSEAARCA